MGLYQKHRPRRLRQVVGNEDTIQSISKILAGTEIPHAFLFTGQSGCGKTTISRIIAKQLGATGSDYKEIDSADFRGIDMVRDLRRKAAYKPIEGTARVWLVDEVHKMTNDAQNAFLKLLEDPPNHAYFLLATTDPQKLLPTIKSRCLTYEMKPLNFKQSISLLQKTLKKEQRDIETDILDIIAETAEGKPRKMLQLLEQVLSTDDVSQQKTLAKAGMECDTQVIELARVLLKSNNWKEVAKLLKELKNEDPEGIRRMVLGYCASIVLNGKLDGRIGLIFEEFIEPTYDNGFNQIIYACMAVINQ